MDLPADIGSRIGILGGTFDPVHNAHLALAEAVKKRLRLDAVVFIPASLPPHKQKVATAFEHRAAMLECALEGRDGFHLTRLEGARPGPSFSVDTLRALRRHLGEKTLFFFILGMDAFAEIATWKEYRNLLSYANLVVIDRPSICRERFIDVVQRDFPEFRREGEGEAWSAPDVPGRIIPLDFRPMAISSTMIRKEGGVARGDTDELPARVRKYIEEHGLYRG